MLCFKTGNISVCSGCRVTFTECDDLVVRHSEYRTFNSPRTGLPTSKYGNAYYHPKHSCTGLKWGDSFQPHRLNQTVILVLLLGGTLLQGHMYAVHAHRVGVVIPLSVFHVLQRPGSTLCV